MFYAECIDIPGVHIFSKKSYEGGNNELRKRDPGCAISAHNIRQLVLHKEIPSRKAGSKYLVALDDVERYFGLTIDENEQNHGIG